MELPYLKRKNAGGGSEPIERQADETHPGALLSMVWDELEDAYHRGDHQGFMSAIRAFTLMTKDSEE